MTISLVLALLIPLRLIAILPGNGWIIDPDQRHCTYPVEWAWRTTRGHWHIYDVTGGICRPIPPGLR